MCVLVCCFLTLHTLADKHIYNVHASKIVDTNLKPYIEQLQQLRTDIFDQEENNRWRKQELLTCIFKAAAACFSLSTCNILNSTVRSADTILGHQPTCSMQAVMRSRLLWSEPGSWYRMNT